MPVTKVRSKWSGGNLQFIDDSGNVIIEIDGPNRRIEPYNVMFPDSQSVIFGTGSDVTMQWNSEYFELAPTSGFWANCPHLAYPDPSAAYQYTEDFIGWVPFASTAGAAGGWKTAGDATYDVTAAAGTLGGQVKLAPEAGSNNEVYHQLGEKGTETYIEYTKSSGKKSWVEFRVAYTSVTLAANMFIGLGEEGSAAANWIGDSGDSFADKDLVGFIVWEADPNALDVNCRKNGQATEDVGLASAITAGTWYTLGIYFDGVETVSYYVDGTAVQTSDLDDSTFPAGEELSPLIGLKNGDSDAAIEIDWIRMVVER